MCLLLYINILSFAVIKLKERYNKHGKHGNLQASGIRTIKKEYLLK